jgi:hypothetical protein
MRIRNTGCNSYVNADPSAALSHCSHWQVLSDSARLVLVLAVQEDAVPVVERTAAPCPGPGLEARATQSGTVWIRGSGSADPYL